MERNTTNVEELFAAFSQPLTGPTTPVETSPKADSKKPVRRDSAHLLLSFLSTIDFEEDMDEAHGAAVSQSFSFDLGMDFASSTTTTTVDHTVTQWAAC